MNLYMECSRYMEYKTRAIEKRALVKKLILIFLLFNKPKKPYIGNGNIDVLLNIYNFLFLNSTIALLLYIKYHSRTIFASFS